MYGIYVNEIGCVPYATLIVKGLLQSEITDFENEIMAIGSWCEFTYTQELIPDTPYHCTVKVEADFLTQAEIDEAMNHARSIGII